MNRRNFSKLFVLGAIASASPLLLSIARAMSHGSAIQASELTSTAITADKISAGKITSGTDAFSNGVFTDGPLCDDPQARAISSIDQRCRWRGAHRYTVTIKCHLT